MAPFRLLHSWWEKTMQLPLQLGIELMSATHPYQSEGGLDLGWDSELPKMGYGWCQQHASLWLNSPCSSSLSSQ